MILLIDNYDSFTYNLARYIKKSCSIELMIIKNDTHSLNEIIKLNPSHLVISPGPGSPKDSGCSLECIQYFKNRIPILGICLGHQCLAYHFGGEIKQAHHILHGKASLITHNNDQIFNDTPQKFKVTRYHSLAILEASLSNQFTIIARSQNDIMAIKHQTLPLYGLQFHPEAYLSEYGQQIINNFFEMYP
jgi:anthranilate synthase/aminodeoxychorismate synthase-like glutamine amidotransferase